MTVELRLTPAAAAFLRSRGGVLTVESVVVSSCCGAPLPPEVRPGPPRDAAGFQIYQQDGFTLYYDTLLEPRPLLEIDLRDYGRLQELVVTNWAPVP